ncbi:MAG: NAD(P)-binding domain-containing protein [Chloroflexota bacterium]|nr:NAD(P)-binding domain-containing protein [Chloroflexota bacterium]
MTELGRPHLILEQRRVVESWRTKRWDSLRLIAPNWSMVLPGFAYPGDDPDGFMAKHEVVEHLVGWATSFGAPVREGVRVTSVERDAMDEGFVLRTEDGTLHTEQVVLATGALQQPKIPPDATELPPTISQMVGADYRNPEELAPGSVLVIGSGETGAQVAEELARSGREVYLSGGRSWWAPRRYRGRDIAAWLRLTGWFDRKAEDLPSGVHAGKPNPQLTGAGGGHDINAHSLARDGVRLVGRLRDIKDGAAYFSDDLAANVAWADAEARALLESIDRVIETQGLDAPAEELPADLRPSGSGAVSAERQDAPPLQLDLGKARIGTVIWATGYRPDFAWVRLPFVDADGYPIQRRGVTPVAGLYVLGLDWLHNAKSGLFAGIGDDATYLSAVIAARTQP